MIKLNVKIETLKKDLEILKGKGIEKIPEFSLSQINLLIEKKEEIPPKKETKETIEKESKFSSVYIFVGIGFFVIFILGILWLILTSNKNYSKVNQTPVQIETTTQPTETAVSFETEQNTSTPPTEETTKTEAYEPLIKADKEINITLQDINSDTLKEVLVGEKIKKESAYSFKKVNLYYLEQRVNFSLLFQKIFNPQVENYLSLKGFLDNFIAYDLGIYYTATREYLIIFAKIKNANVVKTFLDYWLKPKPTLDELNFIFLTDNPGKNLGKYEIKKIDEFDLIRIPFEKTGYGFNLLIKDNYLAIFPHEAVLEYVKNILRQLQ